MCKTNTMVVGLALALSVAVSTAPAFADEEAWEPDAPVWIDLSTDALWNSGYAEAIVVEDEGRMVRLQVRDIVGGSEAPHVPFSTLKKRSFRKT